MGKSSLINLLVPDADIAVREISAALDTGKHTTTFTRLYALRRTAPAIIDSPGFQEFGLYHLSEGMLERAFVEFAPYLGGCKFYNCRHLIEPQCAMLDGGRGRQDRALPPRAVRPAAARIGADAVLRRIASIGLCGIQLTNAGSAHGNVHGR